MVRGVDGHRTSSNLMGEEVEVRPGRGRIIAITSGKGGVGKTNLTLNLGIALSHLGDRVLVFDADLNLANLDVISGMIPEYTVNNVALGQKEVSDILLDGPAGIKVVPASSGVLKPAAFEGMARRRLIAELKQLGGYYDVILIDTAPGLSPGILDFILASQTVVVVTTPEPTAITDAYALIKVVSREGPGLRLGLLVNFASSKQESEEVFEKLNLVVERFLQVEIENFGYLPIDGHIPKAVRMQQPLLLAYPKSKAAKCIYSIARRIAPGQIGFGRMP